MFLYAQNNLFPRPLADFYHLRAAQCRLLSRGKVHQILFLTPCFIESTFGDVTNPLDDVMITVVEL